MVGTGVQDLARLKRAAPDDQGRPKGMTRDDYETLKDGAEVKGIVGPILIGVGAAALISGVIWAIVDATGDPAPAATAPVVQARVLVGPGSAGVRVRF